MDENSQDVRIAEIRKAISEKRKRLKGRMNSREVMFALGIRHMDGDRACISAALSEEGMVRCITHMPGVFIFNPA